MTSRAIRCGVLLLMIGAGALVLRDPLPGAASVRLSALPHRHVPIGVRGRRDNLWTSDNWSGYAITGARGMVTDVKGSWTVPAIQTACSSTNQYASFWIGIDGFNSNTVEQIGTDSDCQSGVPVYYAWFEFYPHWSSGIPLNPQISPGDVIAAEVKSGTGGQFTVSLRDVTTGQSFSTSVKMNNAQRSSAEWIAEAPWSGGVLPLANFGDADYGLTYTGVSGTSDATVNGHAGHIGSFGSPTAPQSPVQKITMVTGSGAPKAQPSGLSIDGSSFQIQWLSAGP